MEAEYQDFMSIEIEEGIAVQLNQSSTKQNQLSSLSPTSLGGSLEDFSNGEKGSCKNRKQPKAQFSFNIRPFSLNDDDDGEAKSQEEFKENDIDVDIDELLNSKRLISYSMQAQRAPHDKNISDKNLIPKSLSNIKQ